MAVKRIIEQAYHRNGVGGHGAVISLFEDDEEAGVFVATSLVPDLCAEALTPDDYAIKRHGEKEAYVNAWLQRFAIDTVVLSLDETVKGNIAFAQGNSWRGADNYGPALAQAWREQETRESYDPALEWYEDQHADPDETARLIEENNREAEAALGLEPGTLSNPEAHGYTHVATDVVVTDL